MLLWKNVEQINFIPKQISRCLSYQKFRLNELGTSIPKYVLFVAKDELPKDDRTPANMKTSGREMTPSTQNKQIRSQTHLVAFFAGETSVGESKSTVPTSYVFGTKVLKGGSLMISPNSLLQ